MEKSNVVKKSKQMRCPECLNYITVSVASNGTINGKCNVCKSIILTKQHSPKEKLIRIVKTQ